ncbi:MAG: hypothetical protein U1E05_03605, partial [Patescibacteria group bacterium]|nr:hypothetical protein [Patescibacteria group bacterium]
QAVTCRRLFGFLFQSRRSWPKSGQGGPGYPESTRLQVVKQATYGKEHNSLSCNDLQPPMLDLSADRGAVNPAKPTVPVRH